MTDKRFEVSTGKGFEISLKDKLMKDYPFSIVCENNDEFEPLLNEVMNCNARLNQLWEQTKRFEKHNQKLIEENQALKECFCNSIEDNLEIDHINNIYQNEGFDGVIDYAKDKLSNYGAVKEVEDGLIVLITGGWSDNEHWIECLNDMKCLIGIRGHYRGYIRGGAFYYTRKPYASVKIVMENKE